MSAQQELEFVIDTAYSGACRAAQVTQRVQSGQNLRSGASAKAGDEPVTIADYASQALILREIQRSCKNVRIISEEASSHLRAQTSDTLLEQVRELVADALRIEVTRDQLCEWIDYVGDEHASIALTIDPIDGTKGFLRGEQYAIAIGVLREGEPVGGVLVCPKLSFPGPNYPDPSGDPDFRDGGGTTFVAQIGKGAYQQPQRGQVYRIRANPTTDPKHVRVLASVEASHGDPKLVDDLIADLGLGGGKVRVDSQVKYGILARGEAEIYLRPRSKPTWRDHVWDHVAGVVIAKEAGARVTDMDGKELDFRAGRRLENNRGVLATHGPMHDRIVEALAHLESRAT